MQGQLSKDKSIGEMKLIGSKEYILLPEVRKSPLVARVDTGAHTSSLHCFSVEVEKNRGKEVLCVRFLRNSRRVVRFHKFTRRKVKSSNGQVQQRYAVRMPMIFGNEEYLATFTLTNRQDMKHAALLGRKFLRNRFIVDVGQKHLLSTPKLS